MPASSSDTPTLVAPTCTVAVVDRMALDRELLAQAVAHAEGFGVGLAAATLVGAPDLPPCDAVVVRATAPGTDLPAEVAAAVALTPRPRVVVLVGYVDDYVVERLRAVGADAVGSSDLSLADVLDLLCGTVPERPPQPADRRDLGVRHRLTTRELEILDHLADGLAPGQIAHLLQIRVSTIRDHVKSLRSKLGCTSATQLVITAHRLGLAPHVGRPLP
jgi:DNA-binding NarL/FixJ family response regulator